ncbi:MAG: hypothetical protein ACRC2O_07080 [Chitinophagaceae bacterium]
MYIYSTDGFMKNYLLLRNNKQSGPYSFDELLEMGLKTQDLIWIDGKSASWRYPGEFDEFKTHPSFLKDQVPDQSFSDIDQDVLLFRPEGKIPVRSFPDEELIEFPTMARFLDPDGIIKPEPFREKIISTGIIPVPSGIPDEVPELSPLFDEKMAVVADESITEEKTQTEPTIDKEIPAVVPKRVSVTLPAAVSDKTFVVIHPKGIEKMPVQTPEIISEPIQEKITVQIPEIKPVEVVERVIVAENIQPAQKKEESPIVYMPVAKANSENLLQKLAIAAGIISIISVAGLIANSVLNPDAYNYVSNQKPTDKKPSQSVSSPTDSQLALTESGNTTAVPSNTNLQLPVPANTTETSGGKNKLKDQPKKLKDNITETAPANTSNTGTPVNPNITAVSSEGKMPAVDPKQETRQNINKLVNYELNNYKVNAFGGVSEFEVVINNNSAYPLDMVVVELKYIQSNKKIFKTERLEFKGIAPKGKQSIGVAKTNRGIKVETTITSISSRELDLGYHQ